MKTARFSFLTLTAFILLLMVSCDKTMPFAPEENTLLDGPMEGLSIEQQIQFLKGDEAFGDDIFTVEKVSVYGAFTKKLVDFNAITAKKLGFKFPFEYNPIISGYSKNAK